MAQNSVGLGHPSEREAWRVGFEAYLDWMQQLKNRITNSSVPRSQQEKAAAEMMVLARNFEVYRNSYLPNGHGALTVTILGGEVPLDDALQTVSGWREGAYKFFAEASYVGALRSFGSGANPKLSFYIKDSFVTGKLWGRPFFKGPPVYRGAFDYEAVLECVLDGKVTPGKPIEMKISGTMTVPPKKAGEGRDVVKVSGTLTGNFGADGKSIKGKYEIYPLLNASKKMLGEWEAFK